MILGADRQAVIANIKNAVEREEFYAKVETNDPVLSKQESRAITDRYLACRKTAAFRAKSLAARAVVNAGTSLLNRNTRVEGLEKLPDLSQGAIITSNHFSPLENTVIRHMVRKQGKKRLNIVSQVTNFAMPGFIGFLMNYADTVPLSQDLWYLNRPFLAVLRELLEQKEVVLIYPEQEMWFHYRKPRPLKRGAYHFAAKLNVPVVSCFVEMVDLPEMETEEFKKVGYVLHILGTIFPEQGKNAKEDSCRMCQQDYEMKKAAYEAAYGKKLDYNFEQSDIAGWIGESHG